VCRSLRYCRPSTSFDSPQADANPIKTIWNSRWAGKFLNSPLHFVIAGRAGYESDIEENEETHKKELTKTGIKMKTEGEFGFEPSLLIQM
jgi:hypothetical protein